MAAVVVLRLVLVVQESGSYRSARAQAVLVPLLARRAGWTRT